MAQRLYLSLMLIVVLGLSGCVVSPLVTGTGSGGTGGGGQLYVATAGSILRYSNALAANGNVAPDVTITGTSSQLNSPQRIVLDVNTDRLFVANQGGANVLVFSPASKAASGSSPSAVLASTGNMVAPFDLAIDAGANLLYVADGQNILVFTGESGLSGNVNTAPARTINFAFSIGAIFLDAVNNRMFIADPTDNAVDILPSVSSVTGAATLLVSPITGAATTLAQPHGMTLDGTGRLIVSNEGGSPGILIFPSLLIPAGGNASPAGTISGSATRVAAPGQLVFNPNNNSGELYVADSQAPGILVFTNMNSASGSITAAPARAIVGSGTQLNASAVNGVALDTTR
jgi:hypothetical protein